MPKFGWQYSSRVCKALPWVISILWSPLIFLSIAEWEFYREFHDRFNQLAIQYFLDDHATVISMIWNGYPVIPYTVLWLAITGLNVYALSRMMRNSSPEGLFGKKHYLRRVLPSGLLLAVLLVFGMRGGFQIGAPLRWGDAYFSNNTFANHLALNGMFTLSRAVLEFNRGVRFWSGKLSQKDAVDIARKLVLQPGDSLTMDDKYALLRYPGSTGRSLSFDRPPKNVVLIMMESFSGDFVGATDSQYNATPNFDHLAKKGVLFDRFFSQGTHTHQGLFATIVSFPNLPGFEYLMKQSHGQQPFRSFISMLHEADFHTIYVYNGSFTWDNQEGFFRNQGMKNFVGRDDYINPKYMDATWGVSDEDMFTRGVEDIRRLAKEGPAFALLQTVSNHAPFDLPSPAPFADLNGPEHLMPRLNGLRYSDWALGKFFELAEKEPWFKDTLFVILGDHGFAYESPKAMMDLPSYHIPLLIYYPGDTKKGGQINHTVGSQVDVLPTVMGLMDIKSVSQSWGRDLFRIDQTDQGWAIIKPSGGGKTVGLIKGDLFFVTAPKMEPLAYRYSLNPWNPEEVKLTAEETDALSKTLHGYVQAAINALMTSHAGVTADDVVKSRK
jgi:phosphoglycerol transferase MdoB-like AlkP superfamily enzyme